MADENSPPDVDPVEERYRRLVDHSPDPMCVHAQGRVVYVNPAGVRGIGADSAEQLVGRWITDFVHPDSVGPMLERIGALRVQGDSSPASEAVMLRLDGSPIEVEAVSVLTAWNGEPAYQVIFRDLTVEKAAEAALRYQAALLNHVSDAIIATTADGVVTSWNPAAEAVYRRPAARALRLPIGEVVDADIDLARIVADGGVTHATHRAADGSPINVRMSVTRMDDGYVLLCSDYTAQRRAEVHFQSVVRSLYDGVIVLDRRGTPQSMNPAARRILRIPSGNLEEGLRRGVISFPVYEAGGAKLTDDTQSILKSLFSQAPIENTVIGLDRADGTRVWLSVNCCLLDLADPDHSDLLISFSDITEEHNTKAHLTYQALHDPLTGLPNRAEIEAQIDRVVRSTAGTPTAVLFIDLDDLKAINDDLGHHAGDIVLKEAAQRLQNSLRTEDFIGRLSGDEFVVLLHGSVDESTLRQIIARMQAALSAPVLIDDTPRAVSASIGVTEVAVGDRREAAKVLQDADADMYRAKMRRKNKPSA
ncbi:sensor domain-containing protein [Mycolicibacterium chubuense]|uniref:sensor domain-containing protein n=1 Tax=Mycolicibacterium chubuense TaxID=1800 RepID=UPI0002FB1C05|nr:sensor domain-containing diguanylate cyclase [Mycolicibacterium chubuense]